MQEDLEAKLRNEFFINIDTAISGMKYAKQAESETLIDYFIQELVMYNGMIAPHIYDQMEGQLRVFMNAVNVRYNKNYKL